MPLPKPGKKEKRSEFVSRCIGDKQTFKDFPDQKQRIAICYTQWQDAKANADVVVGSGDNEVLFSSDKNKIKSDIIVADDQHDLESLEMTISSLKAIKENIQCIIDCYETDPKVKENLVEPWVTAKVAVVKAHINDISDYAMYSEEPSMDSQDMQDTGETPEGAMHEQNPADAQQDLTENYNKPEDITPSYAGEDSSELFPTMK
jgi:hypothetical protein